LLVATHAAALVDQEDEVPISKAVGLGQFLNAQVENVVSGKNLAQLFTALESNARVILLTRVDAVHKARFGLIVVALCHEDEAPVQQKLLHQDVRRDRESTLSLVDIRIQVVVNSRSLILKQVLLRRG